MLGSTRVLSARLTALAAAAVALAAAASALASSPVQGRLGRGTGGCPVFPASSAWHEKVANLPLSPLSSQYVASIGASTDLHPDFGHERSYGIPYSDRARRPAEGSGALHCLRRSVRSRTRTRYQPTRWSRAVLTRRGTVTCSCSGSDDLHRLRAVGRIPGRRISRRLGGRVAGAVFDLRWRDALRPAGFTSADAAGFGNPPGLGSTRGDRAAGVIDHAIRVTVPEETGRCVRLARGDTRRRVRRTPPCHRWACDCACGASVDNRGLPSGRPDHPAGDEDLRADRRRQRVPLVLPGRDGIRAGTTTSWIS